MQTSITIIVPDEMELLAAAQQANAQHLQLLTNGVRSVISPIAIDGFWPVIIKIKNMPERLAA